MDNIDEFAKLFSRQVIDRKNTKKKVVKQTKAEVMWLTVSGWSLELNLKTK